MNPIQVTSDDNKGKSNIRSPEVITFLLSLRYVGPYLFHTRLFIQLFKISFGC